MGAAPRGAEVGLHLVQRGGGRGRIGAGHRLGAVPGAAEQAGHPGGRARPDQPGPGGPGEHLGRGVGRGGRRTRRGEAALHRGVTRDDRGPRVARPASAARPAARLCAERQAGLVPRRPRRARGGRGRDHAVSARSRASAISIPAISGQGEPCAVAGSRGGTAPPLARAPGRACAAVLGRVRRVSRTASGVTRTATARQHGEGLGPPRERQPGRLVLVRPWACGGAGPWRARGRRRRARRPRWRPGRWPARLRWPRPGPGQARARTCRGTAARRR